MVLGVWFAVWRDTEKMQQRQNPESHMRPCCYKYLAVASGCSQQAGSELLLQMRQHLFILCLMSPKESLPNSEILSV